MATLMLATALLGCHHHCQCESCPPEGPGHGHPGYGHPGAGPGLMHGQQPQFYNLPPAQMLMHPGPGVDGPGPGVMSVMPAGFGPQQPHLSQVRFIGPPAQQGGGMRVQWQISQDGQFSAPQVAMSAMDFAQGAIYRLKLTMIPGAETDAFYPTLEIGPATPRTEAFLAHNKIPIQFTVQDFAQVISGNFVTKVIYLPDPEFQDFAVAGGVNELVSSRLDPGVDPVAEAERKGTILAIIRMGNKDFEPPGIGAPGIKKMGFQEEVEGEPVSGGPVPEYGHPSLTPSYISGVTTVPYGMPYTGTPIGLPGPPHLPFGAPAGLRQHQIINHTDHNIPGPVHDMRIHVKQEPGFHYPQPPNTMYIRERVFPGGGQPHPVVPMPAEHGQGGRLPNFHGPRHSP